MKTKFPPLGEYKHPQPLDENEKPLRPPPSPLQSVALTELDLTHTAVDTLALVEALEVK